MACPCQYLKLDFLPKYLYILKIRAVEQLVARVVRDDEVVGSNPASPTNFH